MTTETQKDEIIKKYKKLNNKLKQKLHIYESVYRELDYAEHMRKESDFFDKHAPIQKEEYVPDSKPPEYDCVDEDEYIESEEKFFNNKTGQMDTRIVRRKKFKNPFLKEV